MVIDFFCTVVYSASYKLEDDIDSFSGPCSREELGRSSCLECACLHVSILQSLVIHIPWPKRCEGKKALNPNP